MGKTLLEEAKREIQEGEMWKRIDGYKFPYRINDLGEVQWFRWGRWIPLKIYLTNRAEVRLRGGGREAEKGRSVSDSG